MPDLGHRISIVPVYSASAHANAGISSPRQIRLLIAPFSAIESAEAFAAARLFAATVPAGTVNVNPCPSSHRNVNDCSSLKYVTVGMDGPGGLSGFVLGFSSLMHSTACRAAHRSASSCEISDVHVPTQPVDWKIGPRGGGIVGL